MKTVATNALQRFFKKSHRDSVRSSPWAYQEKACVIIEVSGDENPGDDQLLLARVKTDSGTFTLPFQEESSQILSTYGNGESLKGKRAYVKYSDGRLSSGKICFRNNSGSSVAPVSESTTSFSIGGLLSG